MTLITAMLWVSNHIILSILSTHTRTTSFINAITLLPIHNVHQGNIPLAGTDLNVLEGRHREDRRVRDNGIRIGCVCDDAAQTLASTIVAA